MAGTLSNKRLRLIFQGQTTLDSKLIEQFHNYKTPTPDISTQYHLRAVSFNFVCYYTNGIPFLKILRIAIIQCNVCEANKFKAAIFEQ